MAVAVDGRMDMGAVAIMAMDVEEDVAGTMIADQVEGFHLASGVVAKPLLAEMGRFGGVEAEGGVAAGVGSRSEHY